MTITDDRDLGAFIPSDLDDYGLDPYEFRVYCRIARRAGSAGACWESAANVAEATGMGERTVRRALALLRAAGLVARDRRPGGSDVYRLTSSREWADAEALPEIRTRTDGRSGTTDRGPTDLPVRSHVPDRPVPGTAEGTPPKVLPGRDNPSTSAADAPDPETSRALVVVEEEIPRHKRPPEEVWSPDVLSLTREFATMVRANGHPLPGPQTAAADGWYDAIDKLVRIGPPGAGGDDDLVPSVEEIRATMRWALTVDEFWPANVRSAATFRKQFSRLRAAARRRTGANQPGARLAGAYAEAAAEARRRGE